MVCPPSRGFPVVFLADAERSMSITTSYCFRGMVSLYSLVYSSVGLLLHVLGVILQSSPSMLSSMSQQSTHKVLNSASQAAFTSTKLTLHETRRTPHGASPLTQAMSAWSVKTPRAPSRHCGDARIIPLWSYDHGHARQ